MTTANWSKLLLASLLTVVVGRSAIASPASVTVSLDAVTSVDERYLSIALDTSILLGGEWWTDHKHINLNSQKLINLTRALGPAYLRYGGTDADKVWYDLTSSPRQSPPPGFQLLLDTQRWQQMMDFARHVAMPVMFTLNAGPGPRNASKAWQPDNAATLIAYADLRRDPVAVWELGNEINGFPVLHNGYRVSGEQLGADFLTARQTLSKQAVPARLAGPASAFWPLLGEPFAVLPGALRHGGRNLDIVSWHYYPQQSRRCPIATRPAGAKTLLDPQALDSAAEIARGVFHQVQQHALGTEIWLGETGHAQCGGQAELSDRFASSLWWLDQLGLLALQGTKVQIRQSLLGSDYGLLDEETLTPRPDYWASWLWKQWMGKEVLTAQQTGPSSLRSYAHCRPDRQGFALLLINLAEQPQSVYLPYPGNRARVYELTGPELDAKVLRVNGQVLSYANAMPELPSRPFTQNLTLAPISASFVVFDNPNWPGCQS